MRVEDKGKWYEGGGKRGNVMRVEDKKGNDV